MKIYETIQSARKYISQKIKIEKEKRFYRNLSIYGTAHEKTISQLEKELTL